MIKVGTEEVQVKGGRLPVRVRDGAGLTLVFLHYWGGSHRTFAPVVDRLTSGGGVVSFDHRGWGMSRELPGPYDLEQLADDLIEVVGGLDLSQYVLVGHSMGAKVAQLVAARHPAGLTGLALVAPAPPRPAEVTAEGQQALSHAYDDATTVRAAIDQVLTHRRLPGELRDQVVADSLAADHDARSEWPSRGIAEDISAAAATIEVPTLVLAGEHDRVDPPATLADHLLPVIPTACMKVVAATGHLSPLEASAEIAASLDQFVRHLG